MTQTYANRFANDLDWNLLRTFMVIAEEGSITRAANQLLRGQPAVSQALKRLEESLGIRLVDRGHGDFRLTAAGKSLYRECVDLYGGIARLKDVTNLASQKISGEVSIHLASHVITPLLDDLLSDIYTNHSDVTYVIKNATSALVAQQVQEKSASLGLCLVNRRLPELEYQVIYREFFGLFCGPRHPLFRRENLRMDDLRGLDAVSFGTDDLNDALRPVALLRRQYELDQRIIGQSSQLEEVRRMILCGLGIGPLPVHVVEKDVKEGLLWRLPPYKNPPAVDIYLVTNPKKRLNRAEDLIIKRLKASITDIPMEQRTYWGCT
jgi:DNA-binding transcriptional LysR family regulator